MQGIYTKYSYEKAWRLTSLKDVERMIGEELPDAPVAETFKYVLDSCKKGETVTFMEVAFKQEI